MTDIDAVLVERDGPVIIVSINRPHCRNAVDGATARKLFDAFRAFDADASASVAVFTGTGATFGIFCRRFGVPLIDLGTIRLPRLIGHSQAIDLILTGRPVGGPEALRMGLANRLVPKGEARAHAIELAKEIARFPQTCLRADRLSALRQWDLSEEEAIANEMRGGLEVIASGETLAGATRFASGAGRHGKFAGTVEDR